MGAELATVYLGLGSNLGDRQGNLDKALDYLSQRMPVADVSSVYDTSPLENPDQPRFLNMVCQVTTRLKATELLMLAKGIERKLGRLPGKPNSPRPIDIDILLYDEQVINTPELTIPHPTLSHRAFVLVPLAELSPSLAHPVHRPNIADLLAPV